MKASWPFLAMSSILVGLAALPPHVQPKTMADVRTGHIADLRDSSSSVLARLFREAWAW
ncbi:Hypothetical protein DHA2_153891 [Giardia duodenalis]|uniref:Uncharacterized protein n=1 Tax=Giardia intestinalis TaxID=5741 RepID=V6T9R6_GIAIN|nr:Hypothetical protein DHA2_153891 [Giardia intestinalis]